MECLGCRSVQDGRPAVRKEAGLVAGHDLGQGEGRESVLGFSWSGERLAALP